MSSVVVLVFFFLNFVGRSEVACLISIWFCDLMCRLNGSNICVCMCLFGGMRYMCTAILWVNIHLFIYSFVFFFCHKHDYFNSVRCFIKTCELWLVTISNAILKNALDSEQHLKFFLFFSFYLTLLLFVLLNRVMLCLLPFIFRNIETACWNKLHLKSYKLLHNICL